MSMGYMINGYEHHIIKSSTYLAWSTYCFGIFTTHSLAVLTGGRLVTFTYTIPPIALLDVIRLRPVVWFCRLIRKGRAVFIRDIEMFAKQDGSKFYYPVFDSLFHHYALMAAKPDPYGRLRCNEDYLVRNLFLFGA